jgi:2-keto-4-pentenoate hydratase/2-oxohepta-3-ene-1,7-dioic acid hydratase in catechol pathway
MMSTRTDSITRLFCIGRNYVDHIKELSNAMPETPVIFMKPASSVAWPGEKIHFPKHSNDMHFEVEIIYKIGREGWVKTEAEALSFISELTVGVDLTLRDLQSKLKKQGLSWEPAKAFDQSALVGNFIPYDKSIDLTNITFGCKVNGVEKQNGNTSHMIYPVTNLLVELCKVWKLYPGDLVFTGTPAGVGPLKIGDTIEVYSDKIGTFAWSIVD